MNETASSDNRPHVFLSYSWSSEDYSDRVVKLAEELVTDGIDVVFDKWDLQEGQDKHHFMERSVNDPRITRVLILCDPRYAEKANSRDFGVGTETLIISSEVYREVDQKKFIPIIMERDADGKAVVPTYLDGRIYIDLSDPATEEREYQRLVRNLYGRPELKRPAQGMPPAYLNDDAFVLETGRSLSAFKDAVNRGRSGITGFLDEYLSRLAAAVEREVITEVASNIDLEEKVVASIERFLPYRDEFLDMLTFVGRFGHDPSLFDSLHRFFERLVAIRYGAPTMGYQSDAETENIGFLTWEMFLYSVAASIRAERFDAIVQMTAPYYVQARHRGAGAIRAFDVLDPGFRLLDYDRKHRLQIRWTSVATSMLVERATNRGLPFEALVEADTLLWLRNQMSDPQSGVAMFSRGWYPRTLHFCENIETAQLYVRMTRPEFFQKVAVVLGVNTIDEFRTRLNELDEAVFPNVGNFWGGKQRYLFFFQLVQSGA